jgi:hypothetical protein
LTPRAPAILIALALGTGLGACGGDSEVTDVVPRSTPDLTVPAETTGLENAPTTTSTTQTTDTTTSTTAAPATGTGTATPPSAPGATGGTPPAATTTPNTGGASPDASGQQFEDFCEQNPGAC